MMKLFRNQKGISIVEVLIAAGLTAVVSLGIATMIQNSMIEQKKTVLLATLREKKIAIENMLRDQTAWNFTIRNATNMGTSPANQSTTCLVNPASGQCGEIAATTPKKLIVMDASNGEAYNLLDWAGAGTRGFTEGGAACNTFSSTTGNDACPISYRLVYMYDCDSNAGTTVTCGNPQVKIVARLVFNPSTSGVLHRFRGLIAAGNMSTILSDDAPGMGRYDAMVKRTAIETNRFFRLAKRFQGTSSGCGSPGVGDSGFGQCSSGSYADFTVPSRPWVEAEDPFTMVALSGSGWVFAESGPYSCTVTSQAFSTGGFNIGIFEGAATTPIAAAATTAGLWAAATVVLEHKFLVSNVSTVYTIRQRCDTLAPEVTAANAQRCTLGIYNQPYNNGQRDFVTVNCYKLDRL